MTRSRLIAALRLSILPLLVATAIVLAWKAGYFDLDRRHELARAVERIRQLPGSHLMFAAMFAAGISLGLPSNVGTWLSGALFGVWVGGALALASAVAATVAGYWMARTIAKRPLQRVFGEHRLLRALKNRDDAVTLFQLRVIPVAPFAVLTYVAGIAGVSMRKLLSATVIAGVPAFLAHAFVGTQLMQGLTSTGGDAKRAISLAVGVTVALLLVSVVVAVVRHRHGHH